MKKKNNWFYPIILVVLAIIVRFWGIQYGLPSVYNSTEYFIARHALSFGARASLEPLYFIYPTLYSYCVAALFAVFFLFGKLFGLFNNSIDFAVKFLTEPTGFYLLGRSMNAFALTAAVVLFYQTNKKIVSARMSFAISLLLLFGYNVHIFTFWMVPDAFLLLGTVVVLYFMIKQHTRVLAVLEICFASLVCGLTISVKYNAGFLLLGWIISIFLTGTPTKAEKFKQLLLGFLFSFLGFFLGTPYWLLEFGKFVEGFFTIWSQAYYAYNLETGVPYLWQCLALIKSEWLLGLILLFSILMTLFRFRKKYLPFLFIVIPTILLVGSWEKKGLDYLLVIIPTLLLLFSFLIEDLAIRAPKSKHIFLFIIILAFIFNFPRVAYVNYLRTCPDTRKIASRWIVENIQSNKRICYDHYHYDLDLIDISRFTVSGAGSIFLSKEIKEKLLTFQEKSNNYLFISNRKKIDFSELRDRFSTPEKISPFLREQYSHPYKTFAEIKREDPDLLILNSDTYSKYLNNPLPSSDHPLYDVFLERKQFYLSLFQNLQPVLEIKPSFKQPGPTLKLYKLKE